jgi:hypothetical protein
MSMRNVRWVEDVLARNGGDRELNELIKVLQKTGFEKVAPERVSDCRPNSNPTPEQFAAEVKYVLGKPESRFHNKLKEQLALCGYFPPAPVPKPNPNVFEIDLSGIPVHLQEVFKVHIDLMFGGLLQGEKRGGDLDFMRWDDESFRVKDALELAFKNILKGHMADASNFLMFIKARGWEITPLLFRNSLPPLPWDEAPPPVPEMPRAGTKKPNTGFYTQTHGRNVPDQFISRLKDELFEGKLHWIRTVPGYDDLFHVLALAYDQAARGKGKERHANNKPFAKQPLMQLADKFGTGFLLGQASKKLEECTGLPYGQDVKEILGAIVYSCAAVMHLELEAERNSRPDSFEEDI